jgi:hypothetical protein
MCLRLEFPLTSSWKPRDLGAIVYNLWYRKTTFSSARLRAEAEKDTDLGSAIIESQPEVFVRVATQLSHKSASNFLIGSIVESFSTAAR